MKEQSEIRNPKSEIRVGDLIQYYYEWGQTGFKHRALTTRRVITVVDDGAAFVVEGFYNVYAKDITVHIPMHGEAEVGGEQ